MLFSSVDLINNFGISPSVFSMGEEKVCVIERSTIKKVNSANAVTFLNSEEISKNKKAYEAEDKELYMEEDISSEVREQPLTKDYESSCTREQLGNLTRILSNINSNYTNTSKVIKAYRSKLKTKFYKIYEENSINYQENVKYKLFHKCSFPHCGRTFSSSGWLRAHFNEHLKKMEMHPFNVLFDKVIHSGKKKSFIK